MFVDYSTETTPRTYYGDFWTWPQVPAMRTFIFESPAARLVGEVMDTASVMLVTDNWLIRESAPSTGRRGITTRPTSISTGSGACCGWRWSRSVRAMASWF